MSTIAELESHITSLEERVELREHLKKLMTNKSFKKLILDEYLVQECSRFAHAAGDPALRQEDRDNALAMSLAAGHFKRFLSLVGQLGFNAEREIESAKEEIELIRREDSE